MASATYIPEEQREDLTRAREYQRTRIGRRLDDAKADSHTMVANARIATGAGTELAGRATVAGGNVASTAGRTLRQSSHVKKHALTKTLVSALSLKSQITSWGLRISWITLLFSGGLTTIFSLTYLNIHLFGRLALPAMFAKFGSEWYLPSNVKTVTSVMGGVEIAAIIGLDILVFIVLIGLVAIIDFLVTPEDVIPLLIKSLI